MSPKKLLAGIFALLIVAYGGAYGYMYSKVKNAMDDFALQAMMAGYFDYSGISVSPFSSDFSVNGIQFTPAGYKDAIVIDQVEVQVADMLSLMNASNFNPDMELPEQAGLSLNGVHIKLDADWLQEMSNTVSGEFRSIGYKPTLCGGKWFLGPNEYSEMGITELVMDLSTRYHHDVKRGQMTNNIEFVMHDLGRIDFVMRTSAPTSSNIMRFASFGQPVMLENRLTYTDMSYVQKSNEYCAKASNMSVTEYIEARVAQSDLDYVFSWGFIPGEGIRTAYKAFLTKPTKLEFSIDPDKNFNPAMMAFYSAKDIPSVLNLSVRANNVLITDLSFKTTDELEDSTDVTKANQYSITGRLGSFSELLTPEEQRLKAKQATPKPNKEKPRYRLIKLKDVNKHIGEEVRVYTLSNKVRKGTLEKADGTRLYVVQSLSGGKFTMPVNYRQVAKIEAFY